MSESPVIHPYLKYLIGVAFFMEAVDSTVLNTSIPVMANNLHVGVIELKIALIAYLLSLAIFIPISGWMADKYGVKKIFIVAITVFTLSSCGCGFAENLPQLVIARFCQGLGGALSLPVGRLIILRFYGRARFIVIMNHIITLGATGLMLGPVIGGLITDYLSWHWIFWLNIPIGFLAIICAYRVMAPTPSLHPPPLDILGFLYFGLGLSAFNFGLSALSESLFGSTFGLFIFYLSSVLLILYWRHSKYQSHPIINTELFTLTTFRVSALSNLCVRLAFGGIPFVLPLLFQLNMHYSPQMSGLLLAPLAIGVLFSKNFTIGLLRLLHYKKLLIINTLLSGTIIASFGYLTQQTPLPVIMGLTALYGFITSLQYGAMNSLAYADVPPEKLSAATSIMSTLQQISISMGVAISALLLSYASRFFSLDHSLTLAVFRIAFSGLSIITLVSTLIFLQLQSTDGHQMIQP